MRKTLYFTGPRELDVRTEPIPEPSAKQVRVRTELSAISAGTEMLIYRGEAPKSMVADETLDSLSGSLEYPLTYGYSAVGKVEALGREVDRKWLGRRVFAFHPHTSHFLSSPEALISLPEKLATEEAVFLPNMETAVNLVMDARPVVGERVCIFGQGVVGLLTTALLRQFPLESLVTVEQLESRRDTSMEVGADVSVASVEIEQLQDLLGLGGGEHDVPGGADLIFELTGQPAVLNDAMSIVGYDGRIVVGSWYGKKRAPIDLGSRFHRNRVQIVSSQVSRIRPSYRGRWTKKRRFDLAIFNLLGINRKRLITHNFNISEVDSAFRMLDENAENVLQAVITYD